MYEIRVRKKPSNPTQNLKKLAGVGDIPLGFMVQGKIRENSHYFP
jgi:hypothetical protein